jgi:hypothetical protein
MAYLHWNVQDRNLGPGTSDPIVHHCAAQQIMTDHTARLMGKRSLVQSASAYPSVPGRSRRMRLEDSEQSVRCKTRCSEQGLAGC